EPLDILSERRPVRCHHCERPHFVVLLAVSLTDHDASCKGSVWANADVHRRSSRKECCRPGRRRRPLTHFRTRLRLARCGVNFVMQWSCPCTAWRTASKVAESIDQICRTIWRLASRGEKNANCCHILIARSRVSEARRADCMMLRRG